MMYAFYHLLANPPILACLQEEIIDIMPDAKVIPSTKVLEEAQWLVNSGPNLP